MPSLEFPSYTKRSVQDARVKRSGHRLFIQISSATPFTALISTRSPLTTFAVLHLDGRTDWMISQRNALLAWTGHTLGVKPQLNMRMSIAHWGSTKITGRGLVCLSGRGQVYQVVVKAGEEYIIHPR